MNQRLCLTCQKKIQGRSDKKFCNDYCRNVYNNQQQAPIPAVVKSINQALKRNRALLAQLIPEGQETTKMHRDKLADKGFQFRYFTHQYKNQKGSVYFFVYDYGYLPIDRDWLFLVKRNEAI